MTAGFDCKEYAKRMRKNVVKDSNGNVVCSAELWEQIASIIDGTLQKEGEGVSRQHNYVKILPEYYIAVDEGVKTFEIRFNDRNYKVGDILHLREFCEGQYTGRELTKEICYMIDSPDYCKEGFVVLGIKVSEMGKSSHS